MRALRSYIASRPIWKKAAAILALGFLTTWWFALPDELFKDDYSTVIYADEGALLGARIAGDGQWRFPKHHELPDRFVTALLSYEDERFYRHPGIDLIAVGRAITENVRQGRVVSGASTLSMQVIRMHRGPRRRSVINKIIEALLALRLEMRYSKKEILELWAHHAPFGGNVVGIEAATWRYYQRSMQDLSWGEACTLAVLPNTPSLMHPGKNRDALRRKRDRLIEQLVVNEKIDSATAELAQLEPIPDQPSPLPQFSPHLLQHIIHEGHEGRSVITTIDLALQQHVKHLIDHHHGQLLQNEIHNAAALVVRVRDGAVLSYVGNTDAGIEHGEDVDIIQSARSSGSILKPFLYAAMNASGELLPQELVADVPTSISGYQPKNFYDRYEGAVHADDALARSLNVPAVRMLQKYGVDRFHQKLEEVGIRTLSRSSRHYGLSLVLGGAEVSLWDLSTAYLGMARSLRYYHDRYGAYAGSDWQEPQYLPGQQDTTVALINDSPIDAGASYLTLNALTKVHRPVSESGWDFFEGNPYWAWKTGTSIGHRDAWAVAVNRDYVIAVWVGNADGEGRPELVGVQSAAPILFDIARLLPVGAWFEAPYDEITKMDICQTSGKKAGHACPRTALTFVHHRASRAEACRYHTSVLTDASGAYRMMAHCSSSAESRQGVQFVLPSAMAYYYQHLHPEYTGALPFHPDCRAVDKADIDILYPQPGSKVKIPVDHDGEQQALVIEVAHPDAEATLYWHLDGDYLGATSDAHSFEVAPPAGEHELMVMDDEGERVSRTFMVVD